MSASLVGSEMCIRDRRRPKGQTRARAARVAEAPVQTALTNMCPGLRSVSVSYTHLTLPTICSV
eukprot:10703476-Alexandrium_andersonii.AAC.1